MFSFPVTAALIKLDRYSVAGSSQGSNPQGKVSKAVADAFAIKEYQLYRKGLLESYQSDFDLFVIEQSLNEIEKLAKP